MNIEPYDILLFKGTSIISRIIEDVTKSKYSHVALSLGDNFHIAEAMPRGIMIDHLADLPSGYDVYRYKGNLTDEQKNKLHEFVYLKISTKYNYEELFSALLEEEFGIEFPIVKGKLICSQFVYLTFLYIGIDLLPNYKGVVTPGDLSGSELLEIIHLN